MFCDLAARECGNVEGTPCDDFNPRYVCKYHKWIKDARSILGRKEEQTYRSVTELAVKNPNLAEYITQIEGERTAHPARASSANSSGKLSSSTTRSPSGISTIHGSAPWMRWDRKL